MSEIRTVKFEPEHARGLVGLGPDGPRGGDELETQILAAARAGYFLSCLAPQGLVGIAGATIRWRGVGEATAFTTPLIDQYPIAAVKACRAGLEAIASHFGLWRLQAYVVTDWQRGNRFIKALGFEPEGLLRKFSPQGQDCTAYGRLF